MALEAGEKMADALSHSREGLLLFTLRIPKALIYLSLIFGFFSLNSRRDSENWGNLRFRNLNDSFLSIFSFDARRGIEERAGIGKLEHLDRRRMR